MKILHISGDDESYGSAKCLIDILSYELLLEHVTPVVLTPYNNKINKFCNEQKIENYHVRYMSFFYMMHDRWAVFKFNLRRVQYLLYKIRAFKRIQQKIDFSEIDLIHTNNSGYDIGFMLANKYKISHVWHLREGGLNHFQFKPYLKSNIKNMRSAAAYIAISEYVKGEWVKLGLPEEKIYMLYDGVSIADYQKPMMKQQEKIQLVMCGSVMEAKGQLDLIEAVADLSIKYRNKIHVDFYGDCEGSYSNKIKAIVRIHHMEKTVNLMGYADEIWNILPKYDIGVICSRAEGFGRVTVEYMLAGCAVLASDTGANPEIVRENIQGRLYRWGNKSSLKRELEYMIDHIEDYRAHTITRYQFGCQHFSAKDNLPALIDVFRKTAEIGGTF